MIDPLKIILVAASRRHRHGSERCAGLAAMEVVAGTVFCLSNPASPRLEKGLKYTMRVSDLSTFTRASSSPGSMNSAKISYGFRRTDCTLSRRVKRCSAEMGRL